MVVGESGYGLIKGGILVSARRDCRKPHKRSQHTWFGEHKYFLKKHNYFKRIATFALH
jgi:hypothetical protein